MSNQQWTRAHDALIAERAEGAKPIKDCKMPERLWKWRWPDGRVDFLPTYLTDLAASARAQESWRLQDADLRSYMIESGDEGWISCECRDWKQDDIFTADDPIESAARAWATWRACGGGE